MTTLHIDIETYSSVDLRRCGLYRYVEAADFEITLLAYAYDDGPVQVVDLASGEQMPQQVLDDLVDPAVIKTAFNAQFEITCLNKHFA
jgi:DNA polymerase